MKRLLESYYRKKFLHMKSLRLANHEFALTLYAELAKNQSGNVFFSPFSIHTIMFVASVGADSKTLDEIIASIYSKKYAHSLKTYKDLINELQLIKGNREFNLASGMFIDSSYNVKKTFMKNNSMIHVESLDFKNYPEKQRQYINYWVSMRTRNEINQLFTEDFINNSSSLILANAVYFKGLWKQEFHNTENNIFYLNHKDKVMVKMMMMRHDLKYYYDEKLKSGALELYFENKNFKMIILLPDSISDMENLEKNITKIKLYDIFSKMKTYDVIVKLPHFKLEQTTNMKESLTKLGCQRMFTEKANFQNIVKNSDLRVSQFTHKACIDVDAESVTEETVLEDIELPFSNDPFRKHLKPEMIFVVDHPAIITIVACTDDILLLGRLSNPKTS